MTAIISHKRELGTGVFTSADIALLLGVPRNKVTRYLRSYWDARFGMAQQGDTYSWKTEDETSRVVNFYILLELYMCFKLQAAGVTTKRILKAHERIAHETQSQYPFAEKTILTDGVHILYEFKDLIVNADGSKQLNLKAIIEDFVKKVSFSTDGIAESFYPAGRDAGIVVNPHHQFGQPTVEGTNICTEVLYAMYQSGEQVETLSFLYDIPQERILQVVEFYRNAA